MSMSPITKKYTISYWIFLIVSILLNVAPLGVYTIRAAVESNLVHEKITLTMTVLVVIILTIISLINKIALRSRLWIIMLGVYFCLGEILTPLIIVAVCQILDELIVCPLKKYFGDKKTINREIDKRL